jgi:hypothetical protein
MFGRSEHCPGIIYDAKQHAANAKAGTQQTSCGFQTGHSEVQESEVIHRGWERSCNTCQVPIRSSNLGSFGVRDGNRMLKRSHDLPPHSEQGRRLYHGQRLVASEH